MTQISRERREQLKNWADSPLSPYKGPSGSELRALLADSAWRERVERQVRESGALFRRMANAAGNTMRQEALNEAASVFESIVDTGEQEDEG